MCRLHVSLVFMLLLCACSPSSTVEKAPKTQVEKQQPVYSPFVVEMSSSQPLSFSVISFKDVGMSIDAADRDFTYELLAESVAEGLEASFSSEYSPVVRHIPEILDAHNHVACESGHIYVDLWDAPKGAGYSLWSGCGEDDRFALRELASADTTHLAKDIAKQLRRASDTGCFTSNC